MRVTLYISKFLNRTTKVPFDTVGKTKYKNGARTAPFFLSLMN